MAVFMSLAAGTLVDYTNTAAVPLDLPYASLSAPVLVRCEVWLNGVLVDVVYARESHSWWAAAGGGLLSRVPRDSCALQPEEHLVIKVDGPAALRIDGIG